MDGLTKVWQIGPKVEITKGHKYDIIIILGGFKWPLESISVVVRSDALQDICYVFT